MALNELPHRILELLPADGAAIGNKALKKALGKGVSDLAFEQAKNELVAKGLAVKGRGRGGSLKRAEPDEDAFGLETQAAPEKRHAAATKKTSKKKAKRKKGARAEVIAYQHDDRRVNNPEVGMVDPDTDPDAAKTRWAYDPHIDPALQFDTGRAEIEKVIDDALASGDETTMREALETLRRMAEPYLNWTGKAERTSFEVDTVSLHVHERINPVTILTHIRKRMKQTEEQGRSQGDMFRAWFEEPLPYREAIEFYKHDRGWSNRLIAGDSLLVMNSLLQKEGMAGQVQMIYIDPPYGIKYGSNFQPFVNKRDVKDRKDEDLTQEPEMIKAFRDTWELGIHSYLTYLRDRLLLARELLHESGSVFVQISDENLHNVYELLAEIFDAGNFISVITVKKTSGLGSGAIKNTADYIIWFCKNRSSFKFAPLFSEKSPGKSGATGFKYLEEASGNRRAMRRNEESNLHSGPTASKVLALGDLSSSGSTASCMYEVVAQGGKYFATKGKSWKTTVVGMNRLFRARRVFNRGLSINYVRYLDDFPVFEIDNVWEDLTSGFMDDKTYAVQTNSRIIERCVLMSTYPGDIVLDPTCGSGTTAFVSEKWGRRWITCDTSRVAVTLAKQRLMTASYDYYELKYPHEGLKGGFIYKTVPHVTLKAIANNPEIDEIWERMHPGVESALGDLNKALRAAPPEPFKVTEGGRKGFEVDFSATASKTMELPSGESAPVGALLEWEVPFDYPEEWPKSTKSAFDAFHAARQAMQRKMDESIAAHADQEILYDQPEVSKDKLRITGPFTVEAVPFPSVVSLEDTVPAEEADAAVARSGESARQHAWRDELLKTGIRGRGGQILKLAELETLPSLRHLHCSGTVADTGERVVVSFGPEYGALEQRQVELAIREAGELFPRPKMIVFCAFAFDPEAAKDIDATKGIVALKAQMNTDLLTEDLKKNRSSNQSFWLMGQPEVEVRKRKDGQYEVEVHGFDYYDTKTGELVSGGKSKIAAWMLDTDYDERSLFPAQVFFPMAGKKDGWHKLKKDIKAELDERLLDRLHDTVSLPFEAGDNRRVAVKIVDDRGIESLKVIALE